MYAVLVAEAFSQIHANVGNFENKYKLDIAVRAAEIFVFAGKRDT